MKTLAPFALAGSALLALTLAGGAQAQDAARDIAADPAEAGWLTVGDGVGVLSDPLRMRAASDGELRISRDGSRVIAGDALLPAEGADFGRAPRFWPVDRSTRPTRTEDAGVIRIAGPVALVTAGSEIAPRDRPSLGDGPRQSVAPSVLEDGRRDLGTGGSVHVADLVSPPDLRARGEDLVRGGDIVISAPGSLVFSTPPTKFNLPPVVAVIPEPQIYAMLLAGLGVVGALAARRRRA